MITITFMVLGLYVLPAVLAWNFMRLAHSDGGKWYDSQVEVSCLVFTLVPLINIAPALDFIVMGYRKKGEFKERDKRFLHGFFRIKVNKN